MEKHLRKPHVYVWFRGAEINFHERIMSVDCGYAHIIIITDMHKIYICGKNSEGQLGLGDYLNRSSLHELKF